MNSIQILLPNHLGQGFDYAVPEGFTLSPGDYVRVPFGNRELPGVVWGKAEGTGKKLKTVLEHYTHLPPMQEAMRRFIDWSAWYAFAPRGAVLRMALPVAEALKAPGPRERATLPDAEGATPRPVQLSPEQREGADTIIRGLSAGFSTTLIDGVTGSGKTEVYFEALAETLAGGGQALVLLPEISLSVQWLSRFEKRFGFTPLTWHSGLPPGARKHTWRAVAQGEGRVVVGARSALFLPYRDLRLIVVDEEHDSSYKQEDGVLYHARDMAVARARFEEIPAVLVSATPSLETMRNVEAGRYGAIRLHARHGGATLPDVQLIDMKKAPLERGHFLSGPVRQALAETLAAGQQSLLFLNRRGYAPLTLCRSCGHRFQCPHCTAWLVMHKKTMRGKQAEPALSSASCDLQEANRGGNLMCHHCGYTIALPKRCPSCQAEETLHPCGPGVQRIAEEVADFLPQARTRVMASDAVDSHAELQSCIEDMEKGAVDVLIGTQMIAKGHHFAGLSLVGVVDADIGLSGGDLRAGERTWQLLHQVSGRAGRESVSGKVLVQSFLPTHPVMQALVSGNRERFIQLETAERERGRLPPFSRLAALIVEGVKEEEASRLARDLARACPRMEGVEVLGPAPAPLFMLRGKFRFRLLVRAARQVHLQEVLSQWLAPFRLPSSLRIKVDIDPQSFW